MKTYKSPLHKTVETTKTDVWNDSCSVGELEYAIEHGATGATTNPVIVGNVLDKEMNLWDNRIRTLIGTMSEASEEDIAWKLNEEMAVKGAELLLPVFRAHGGKKGRISIQTNARYYRNWKLMADQAEYFNTLAENIQVKIPVTAAGVKAIEEATYRGVNINATVSFTLPQALAVAEAVERGLKRREGEGKDTSSMAPVCTIMVGRLDDWLKVVAEKEGIIATPGLLEWPGVAVFKRAYGLFQERNYRCRLLAAAYRNHYHWSEFIGGDVVLTIPYSWQKRFNNSDVPVEERMGVPVEPAIIDELLHKFDDFRRAWEPEGMSLEEFDQYGATRRTLRSFISGYEKLLGVIRNFMISDPDKK
ncbi:MAG: transaldolase family protein [Spirochaetales bacterium]|nr:transaldolase family protein [Spirochaetales bacterium]